MEAWNIEFRRARTTASAHPDHVDKQFSAIGDCSLGKHFEARTQLLRFDGAQAPDLEPYLAHVRAAMLSRLYRLRAWSQQQSLFRAYLLHPKPAVRVLHSVFVTGNLSRCCFKSENRALSQIDTIKFSSSSLHCGKRLIARYCAQQNGNEADFAVPPYRSRLKRGDSKNARFHKPDPALMAWLGAIVLLLGEVFALLSLRTTWATAISTIAEVGYVPTPRLVARRVIPAPSSRLPTGNARPWVSQITVADPAYRVSPTRCPRRQVGMPVVATLFGFGMFSV